MARKRSQRKGTLRRAGPSWILEWREYVPNDEGKLAAVRKSQVIAPAIGDDAISKREAQRKAWDEVLEPLDKRNVRPSSMMTVEDFVRSKFEPQVVWKKKPGGQKHYGYLLRKLIWTCRGCGKLLPSYQVLEGSRKPKDCEYCECKAPQSVFGHRRLCDVTLDDVERVTAYYHRQGLSTQSVLHFKNCISAIFRRAKLLRLYTDENPARDVELAEVRHERRATFSWDQCKTALNHIKSPYREMCLTSAATSMNVAELCGLRRKHANLTAEIVTVDGEVMAPYSLAVRENWYEGERGSLKSGSRKRNVPIDRRLAEMLAALVAASKHQGQDFPLFCSRAGTPVDAHNVTNRHFKPLAKKLGFPIAWHAFRRAHSTFAAASLDVPLGDRVATMGHADAGMTLYYDVASIERRRVLPERIMERLVPERMVPENVVAMPKKKGA